MRQNIQMTLQFQKNNIELLSGGQISISFLSVEILANLIKSLSGEVLNLSEITGSDECSLMINSNTLNR